MGSLAALIVWLRRMPMFSSQPALRAQLGGSVK